MDREEVADLLSALDIAKRDLPVDAPLRSRLVELERKFNRVAKKLDESAGCDEPNCYLERGHRGRHLPLIATHD